MPNPLRIVPTSDNDGSAVGQSVSVTLGMYNNPYDYFAQKIRPRSFLLRGFDMFFVINYKLLFLRLIIIIIIISF